MDRWYARSPKEGDTHYGYSADYVIEDSTDPHDDGIVVTARCGVMFRPQRPLFDDNPLFGRDSVDPLQACPRCRAAGLAPTCDPDPDGAAVRDLIETLNSSPMRKKGDAWVTHEQRPTGDTTPGCRCVNAPAARRRCACWG
ncbi:MAG: hypothetical protein ACRDQU_12490 [Pseudonocardiaceae bacterium]